MYLVLFIYIIEWVLHYHFSIIIVNLYAVKLKKKRRNGNVKSEGGRGLKTTFSIKKGLIKG